MADRLPQVALPRVRLTADGLVLDVDTDATRLLAGPEQLDPQALRGRRLWSAAPGLAQSPLPTVVAWSLDSARSAAVELRDVGGAPFLARVLPDAPAQEVVLELWEVDHPRLVSRLESSLAQGRRLLELTQALAPALTVQQVSDAVTDLARRALGTSFCGIAVLDEDAQTLSYVSLNPLPEATAEQWAKVPLSVPAPVTAAVTRRTALFHQDPLEAEQQFPGIAAHLQVAGAQAVAHLPLLVARGPHGGQVLGTLALAWTTPRRMSQGERDFVTTVAGACAQALQRAMLYEQQATVSQVLQRAFLPEALPHPTGWELAARFVPATAGVEVGGDWYDAFTLPTGGLCLLVGDAAGHGLAAAKTMASLRNAARAFSFLGAPPGQILRQLNGMLCALEPDALATIIVIHLDPPTGAGVWASAGHLPLLHCTASAVELVEPPDPDPPLGGLAGAAFTEHPLTIAAGEAVLLFTDGLVERRGADLDADLSRLLDVAAGCLPPDGAGPEGIDGAIADLVGTLVGGGSRDDVCVLGLRRRPAPGSDQPVRTLAQQRSLVKRVSQQLEPRLQSAGQAREITRATLAAWGMEDVLDAVMLLVSEMVTNAVTHAHTALVLDLSTSGDAVNVSVTDSSSALPRHRTPGPAEEHGRGVHLIDVLSSDWGTQLLPHGKRVWARIDVQLGDV